jgi:MoaA/NifB/PqqE/SkfB family radical SAM enzyme
MRKYDDVVTMYLLTHCDMECSFCYASKDIPRMTLDQAKWILDFFHSLGADRVSITGGEPLMHPNVEEVLKHAHSLGFKVNLFTSGSLLTETRIDQLSPFVRWVTLSLDGDKEINEAMGRRPGHFEAATNALTVLSRFRSEVNVRVVTVVTKKNIGRLDSLARHLAVAKRRPTWWRLKQMVPLRTAKKHESELAVSDADFLADVEHLKLLYGAELDIAGSLATSKSGDIMIIHPDGLVTTTVQTGPEFTLSDLGNIFSDPTSVVENWWASKDPANSLFYQNMWKRASG